MKLRHLPSLCAALLALCPILANAQTSAVPNFISYQGYVVDASGNAVGADTPVNRTVIFRIWDHQSSSNEENLMYSEQQTVTISDGEFSVLVGQGVVNNLESFGYSESLKKEAGLSNAFEGSGRFLGVTVASSTTIATTDNEISPRQQIVSTAFAMRAKFAESANFAESAKFAGSIGSSSDLRFSPISGTASNYGLGWYGTDRPFSGTAVDGPVLYGNAGGALGSNAEGSQNTALRWDASGRVGIGATSISSSTNKLTLQGDHDGTPADQLTIQGDSDNNKQLRLGYNTTSNQGIIQSMGPSAAGPSPTSAGLVLNPSGGRVGIGGIGHARLHVGGAGVNMVNFYGPYIEYGAVVQNGYRAGPVSMGISANDGIVSFRGFYVTSDSRIKAIEGVSIGDVDLQTLLDIEITDYRYLDKIGKGDAPQKKVIAQQVEKVFPLAVTKTTGVIPDIYQKATTFEGWIKLKTPLKKGDRVRLIGKQSSEIYEVLEVKEDGFLTSYQSAEDEVFVFGREVSDFRVIDYDAISMLNVSATQELKREKDEQIQALRNENSELRDSLAAQEKRLTAMDAADKASAAKLAAIEAMLSADQPVLRTVSLKTAE